jgi:adenosylcobinamide-phosphate synthase
MVVPPPVAGNVVSPGPSGDQDWLTAGARTPPLQSDLACLALAIALDALLGEPHARWHPVAAMGQVIASCERRAPRAPHAAVAYGAMLAVGGTLVCFLATRRLLALADRHTPMLSLPMRAIALKTTFAVRALDDAALDVATPLAVGDLPAARSGLRALVSRETAGLDEGRVAAAAVESVAENLADSFVAPLFWYALLGVPGAVAYRFANTCDAMLGYRGRYEYLGKFAARLDDSLSWLPARLTAAALVSACVLTRTNPRGAWQTMWRHHARTASPNAGWPMSAAAGALGVRLEKLGHYTLGAGQLPDAATIHAATALMRAAAALAFAAYAGTTLVRRTCAAAA